MDKEMKNLYENGTYEEVKHKPWMVVVPSMWVINRTTDDDGKGAGKLKARKLDWLYGATRMKQKTTSNVTVRQLTGIRQNF